MDSLPRPTSSSSTGPRLNKTCDQCRSRKIRCIIPDTASTTTTAPICISCTKRGQICHFSIFRRKIRVRVPGGGAALPSHGGFRGEGEGGVADKMALGDTFIDRILQCGQQDVKPPSDFSVFTTGDDEVPSSGLAFFSEQKVASLTEKLGTSRLRELVQRLDGIILDRLGYMEGSSLPRVNFEKPGGAIEWLGDEEAGAYVDAFFANVHPVYPFLDRQDFEAQISRPDLRSLMAQNPSFSALYYTVLALGSQFLGEGTYEPGRGKSWELYQMALGHMSEILLPREGLENVQALAAMSIYTLNPCSLQLDDCIISQAARMLIPLRYHKSVFSDPKHLKVFWVIYALEKQQSMHSRTSSIIPDDDICCVLPSFPEAQHADCNLFVTFIRIGRISSIVYNSLFSISATLRSPSSYQAAIAHVRRILEEWRLSIPADLRPGSADNFPKAASTGVALAALQVHFSYYQIVIGLERLTLHLDTEDGAEAQMSRQRLMDTARTILELTKFIDVQPYTPVFILAVLPISAIFILFDFVVHNPHHRESRTNLSLLESAAGYFSLIEMASQRALPGSVLAEFAQIAREYYLQAQSMKPPPVPPAVGLKTTKMAVGEEGGEREAEVRVKVEPDVPQPSQQPSQPQTQLPLFPPSLSTLPNQLPEYDTSSSFPTDMETDPTDYLSYPTPLNFTAASDFHSSDAGVVGGGGEHDHLKTMFGWAFPAAESMDWGADWDGGLGVDLGVLGGLDGLGGLDLGGGGGGAGESGS
ncbi:hypothetical protein BU24DRAFT_490316 [Aaosphaeria arxii CBS 175.79]|uniref:Zn(2)-C6 fungal-type domain-containing protein n=1 Tax=Aaosphaeria arxii CBS 175.79 TaxID=1450172 RepID=A0A6A5XVU2_9PLEO|nr:uncharacterized protein BU24DRAFT_490316 [Aaosphaeria arxii CBS 175.79]KAF2017079.1 hypothetical protein BU24DRAFT_490316 [Aaosphaeria arxii CBS 175.79]